MKAMPLALATAALLAPAATAGAQVVAAEHASHAAHEAGADHGAHHAHAAHAGTPVPQEQDAARAHAHGAAMPAHDADAHESSAPARGAVDTRPPPGHVAPPPPAVPMHDMAPAEMVEVMGMDDRARWSRVVLDRLERVDTGSGNALAWSLRADYGGDVDRVQLRSEGERSEGRVQHGDVELLWSHAVAPFWNSAIGVRRDVGSGVDRDWVAFGVHGLAPYWFEVSATAYVGGDGRTALRVEAEYEALLTQRWVLQPRLEVDAYGKDDPAARTGSGLADAAVGLRLRYEVTRGFAPYAGVEWARRFGRSATYARAHGDEPDDVRWVVGVRLAF